MAGMGPKRQQYSTWAYPPIGAAMAMVGLEEIGVYISCHHNMVTQYITTHPIMDLCLAVELNRVMRLSSQWWEQPVLDILGIRVGNATEEGREETGL